MIHWKKAGLLYHYNALHPKLMSHAANPLPMHLEGDSFRIFFSGRDAQNRSSVGAVDIDIVKRKVIQEFSAPQFQHGTQDSFYSHGVSIGNTYQSEGNTYLLFMGWKIPENGHWFGQIGRLRVDECLTLSLDSDSPFMPLDAEDPISLSYPWVEKRNDQYRMWYGSTIDWDAGNGEMVHVIKYAESSDGHQWQKYGQAIPHKIGAAQAFSRPTVLSHPNGQSSMWFSYRSGDGTSYRIGQSNGYPNGDPNGTWSQAESVESLSPAAQGWDAEMVEYPCVWQHKDQLYMLYNGNSYGKTGFGLACADYRD